MSQRVTKCTVCGESGHTRLHCLVMCGVCCGDKRECGCEQPAKRQKVSRRGGKKVSSNQPQPSQLSQPEDEPQPVASSSPEVNYKSLCRQLKQKNQQLGKAYQELKAQFDELQRGLEEKETEFEQAQQDAEEMAGFVRSAEEKIATYKRDNSEQQQQIQTLRQQLTELQNRETASAQPDDITTAKVDRNDLGEIHRRYSAVLSIIRERKCSLNNAYRLAGTPRSTIRDFLGIAELCIVNERTYESTMELMSDPKLSVKAIEKECRRQLGGLLPFVHRLRLAKKLLPLTVGDNFYS